MTMMLLAHGSSDSTHAEQVDALANKVSELLGEAVGTAFLGDERLPQGSRVLPLFLGAGKHVTEDIPKLVAASNCTLLPSLNQSARLIAGMTYDQITRESKRINVLFALYHFAGFESLVAAIHSMNNRCSKTAMATLHGEPSVTGVLDLWHDDNVTQVIVQPMLLFTGRSLARVQAMIEASRMTNISLAPVLSEHPNFAAFIAGCLRQDS